MCNITTRIEMETRAERIEYAIDNSGLSKAEIARRINVRPQSIQSWIKTGSVEKKNLLKLAKLTNFSYEWIITGEGDKRSTAGLTLNTSVLSDVIAAVEECLDENGLTLDPTKKARLIELLYSDYSASKSKIDTDQINKLIILAG